MVRAGPDPDFASWGNIVKPRLAEFLICPECRGPLRLDVRKQEHEEIVEGEFECRQCSLGYPIRGGIPRFVPGDAYAASFSFEWKRWRRTQFDTATRQTSETTFLASTGIRAADLRGKLVLDAGCGAGRYMDLAAQAGAEVLGVDLSLAIEVAKENLGHYPNTHFIQADLLALPLRPGIFDVAYSLGVLHHTPSTRYGFSQVAQRVKPGGEVALWVYPRRRLTETFRYFPGQVNEVLAHDVRFRVPPRGMGLMRRLAPLLDGIMETSSRVERFFTTRLPARWLYALCHVAIPLYYLYRIPLFYPLRLVTKIAMDPDPEWRALDTFDWYSTKYQWKHTYEEVRAWFAESRLEDIALLPCPVAVRGRKAAA